MLLVSCVYASDVAPLWDRPIEKVVMTDSWTDGGSVSLEVFVPGGSFPVCMFSARGSGPLVIVGVKYPRGGEVVLTKNDLRNFYLFLYRANEYLRARPDGQVAECLSLYDKLYRLRDVDGESSAKYQTMNDEQGGCTGWLLRYVAEGEIHYCNPFRVRIFNRKEDKDRR